MALGRVLKALLVSLLLAASAYAVAKLNLFGLESASDDLADGVYQRITAADYGADRKGQRLISVVYLDESSMEAMKGFGWNRFPPTYDQQGQMFDDVMSVGGAPPAAVYADYVYTGQGGPNEGWPAFLAGRRQGHPRGGLAACAGLPADPLTKIACIEASGGMPMIFAKPSPAELDVFTDVQRQLDPVAVLAPALVGLRAYPMITLSASTRPRRGARRARLRHLAGPGALRGLVPAPPTPAGSPSFAALKAPRQGALAGGPLAPRRRTQLFNAPLDVVWGSRPDPDYLRDDQGGDRPRRRPAGARRRLDRTAGEQMAGVRGPRSGRPPGVSVRADAGLRPHRRRARAAAERPAAPPGRQAGAARRPVPRLQRLGGVAGARRGARRPLPRHGDRQPDRGRRRLSAQRHHGARLRPAEEPADRRAGVLRRDGRDGAQQPPGPRGRARGGAEAARAGLRAALPFCIFGASIGVVVLATWLGVAYAHRSPINWIGISACVLGFLFYATRETLPADILGSIEHLRWCNGAWRRFDFSVAI